MVEHHPRRGSMQFWPRKRAAHPLPRVHAWVKETKAKPLGFIGYKAGMVRVQATDNRSKSITKGEKIMFASTVVECPPMMAVGAAFYAKYLYGMRKVASVFAEKLPKELARTISFPKKSKHVNEVSAFDDVKLVVHSQPQRVPTGSKKPQLVEVALGGTKEDKIKYIKEVLGKEIPVADVFDSGTVIDVHGITTGKGFQGTVKRFGVPIRQHKAEKTKRGIGTLGAWHPNRVLFTVPQSGKMGYHQRTEYNKQIIALGNDGKKVTPSGGIVRYGIVQNTFLVVKGSVVGPRKRAVLLTHAIRPDTRIGKDAFAVVSLSP
ncbi:MAG: 50S ribosomal protein L3 [Nanoarchaeota archaeon]